MAYLSFLYLFGLALALIPIEVINPFSDLPKIIFWIWRCDYHLVQISNFQLDIQGDVLVTALDLCYFPNILTTTIFHVHSWKLVNCETFLPELLPSGETMITRRWFYNCWELHVHHNICIKKLRALSSYFLYLYGFISTLFSIYNNIVLFL